MLKHGFSGILRDTHKNLQIFLEAFDLDEKKLLKSRLIELKRENNTIFLSQSQFRDFRFTGLQNKIHFVISFIVIDVSSHRDSAVGIGIRQSVKR